MIVHVRAKFSGEPTKLKLFHVAMYLLDADWPYCRFNPTPVNVGGSVAINNHNAMICVKCKGKKYNCPKLSANAIRIAAKQFGIKTKIKYYNNQDKCKDGFGVLAYTAPNAALVSAKK
jgi:hypothetical protein